MGLIGAKQCVSASRDLLGKIQQRVWYGQGGLTKVPVGAPLESNKGSEWGSGGGSCGGSKGAWEKEQYGWSGSSEWKSGGGAWGGSHGTILMADGGRMSKAGCGVHMVGVRSAQRA